MKHITLAPPLSKSKATLWFWGFAGFFALVWVLLPALLHTGYRNDCINLQSTAPQWVWATTHPMLPAWMLEILNILTARSFATLFIVSQFCTLLALWSVWKLARIVLAERLALIAAFSVLPYKFFTTESILYNHNNVLIAFWCLSMYLVFQALQTNRKRYWIAAGIALGLTFHAKYAAVFLVISILAYMFTRKEYRKYFRTPGPYITTLLAFLIFLPHVIWLFSHHFAPISYAYNDRPALTEWYQQVFSPFRFAGSQLIYLIPTIVIITPIIGFFWKWKIQRHEQNQESACEKYLFYCFIIPLLCHMLYCGIKGVHLRMAYGAPFWVFGGLWLLLRFQQSDLSLRGFRRVLLLTITVELILIAGFLTRFYAGKQVPYVYYPMKEMGATCEQIWHQHTPDPCPYIGGNDNNFIGLVACAMSTRPCVLVSYGTWAEDDDLNQNGGMIVWERTETSNDLPESLRERFPRAEVLPDQPELPYNIGGKTQTIRIGIAIVHH